MSFWTIFLIIVVVIILYFFITYKSGNPEFWKVATSNPNLAYNWFVRENCWIIVHPGEDKIIGNEYTGPFRLVVPKIGNQTVKIYGKSDQLEGSQRRFMEKLAV